MDTRRNAVKFTSLLGNRHAVAKPGLQFAAEKLWHASLRAPELDDATKTLLLTQARKFVGTENDNKENKEQLPPWLQSILDFIYNGGDGSGMRGTDVNRSAQNLVGVYLVRALEWGYNLDDRSVQLAYAYFCLALQTEGFADSDTGGTTMGNFTHGGPTAMGAFLVEDKISSRANPKKTT
jgi:hypothetical protein